MLRAKCPIKSKFIINQSAGSVYVLRTSIGLPNLSCNFIRHFAENSYLKYLPWFCLNRKEDRWFAQENCLLLFYIVKEWILVGKFVYLGWMLIQAFPRGVMSSLLLYSCVQVPNGIWWCALFLFYFLFFFPPIILNYCDSYCSCMGYHM